MQRNSIVSQTMGKYNMSKSPVEFSKLYLVVEERITALSDVILKNICKNIKDLTRKQDSSNVSKVHFLK